MKIVVFLITTSSIVFLMSGCLIEDKDWDPVYFETVETGTFVDARDGTVYKWSKEGTKIWMAENLAWLPEVTPQKNGSDTIPCYYVYGFDSTNVLKAKSTTNFRIFGVLYNAKAAKSACPAGWHLPYKAEWDSLAKEALGFQGSLQNNDWSLAGLFLKAKGNLPDGSNIWTNTDLSFTTDTMRFGGLPGGCRFPDGTCNWLREVARWWEQADPSNKYPRFWELNSSYKFDRMNTGIFASNILSYGLSVRCVKN